MSKTLDFNFTMSGYGHIKDLQGKIEDKIFKIILYKEYKTIFNFNLMIYEIAYGAQETWFKITYAIKLPNGDEITNECNLEDFLKLVILN